MSWYWTSFHCKQLHLSWRPESCVDQWLSEFGKKPVIPVIRICSCFFCSSWNTVVLRGICISWVTPLHKCSEKILPRNNPSAIIKDKPKLMAADQPSTDSMPQSEEREQDCNLSLEKRNSVFNPFCCSLNSILAIAHPIEGDNGPREYYIPRKYLLMPPVVWGLQTGLA